MSKLITSIITKDDIELENKLDNMLDNEISDTIYEKCFSTNYFSKIEDKIWALMNNSAESFSKYEYYDGLAKDYDYDNEHDLKSAEVYNCDLLYMTAIAAILKLPRPKTSCDTSMFF